MFIITRKYCHSYLSFFVVFEKFNYRTLSYFEIIVVVARQRHYVKPELSRLS